MNSPTSSADQTDGNISYTLQRADKSRCQCGCRLLLLCPDDPEDFTRAPAWYFCPDDRVVVGEAGVRPLDPSETTTELSDGLMALAQNRERCSLILPDGSETVVTWDGLPWSAGQVDFTS